MRPVAGAAVAAAMLAKSGPGTAQTAPAAEQGRDSLKACFGSGSASVGLTLSICRAETVLDGLEARGFLTNLLHLVGHATSEPAVEADVGVDSRENRIVEITWR